MKFLTTSIHFLLLVSATTFPVQANVNVNVNVNDISSSSSSSLRGDYTRQRPRSMVEEDNPVPPPTSAHVPCQSAADCAGPVYMLTKSPINEVAEEEEEGKDQSDTSSSSTEATEYGFKYKPEEVSGGDGMDEVLCVPHSSNDGSFVCSIRTSLPMPTGDATVNASNNNRECQYSPAMQRTICIITEAMGGVAESDPETKPIDEAATPTALVVLTDPPINEEEEEIVPKTERVGFPSF